MSERTTTIRDLAILAGITYGLTVLLTTPRGDRIMAKLDTVLFPPAITGEKRPAPAEDDTTIDRKRLWAAGS